MVKNGARRLCGKEYFVCDQLYTWQMVHFDVQLLGGIALHHRAIAEMQTGEGKTLTATLPLYLAALTGEGTHLATVNDYLAQRVANWMRPIYETLGMSVGAVYVARSRVLARLKKRIEQLGFGASEVVGEVDHASPVKPL